MENVYSDVRGDWEDIFPFEPYEKQVRGINHAVVTLRENGLYLLEGECGTGKTLIALTAGLSAIRDPDTKFKRIFVITSKKQQMRAFESDLEEINEHGTGYFQGLSLVGKPDVCPYVQNGQIEKSDIYHRCIELRDNTNRLMSDAVKEERAERKADAGFGLAVRAKADDDPFTEQLEVAGVEAPYQSTVPEALGEEYCPFFAQHFVNDFTDDQAVDIDQGTTAIETLQNGMAEGTCPHAAMKSIVMDGEVLFGNYNHIFSPMTVEGFTGKLFDESTILIIDEAHELVSQVRSQLSHSVTMQTFSYAIRDVDMVLQWLQGNGHGGKVSVATGILERADYEIEELVGLRRFLKKAQALFRERIINHLEGEYGSDWSEQIGEMSVSEDSVQIQEEGPGGETTDVLEQWVDENGVEGDWVRALYLSYAVAYIRESVMKKIDQTTPEGEFAIENVRELLYRWLVGNHTEYFREVKLNPVQNPNFEPSPEQPWQQAYHAEVRVNNCVPADEIAATLDAFGGAIVMSATLEPLDVYREVTGIDKLAYGAQPVNSLVTKAAERLQNTGSSDSSDQEDGEDAEDDDEKAEDDFPSPEERRRQVTTSTFDMDFPPENRGSFAVTAPKFTYGNRNLSADSESIREIYENVITTGAATTPGNVLVFMPSYEEADWAAKILEESPRVEKPVLADGSSSDAETERLKREFFRGEGKVLTTGLRGTLTEGVDFSGSKLHGTVICGVPIAHTGSELANAIEEAYAARFGEWSGFDYAFTVPAVWKTRQAIGRVIRGTEDVGVRILADVRYTDSAGRAGVLKHFPDHSQGEFQSVSPGDLEGELKEFWSTVPL